MIKQVIVYRSRFQDEKGVSFGLRTGKIAAQCAHASLLAIIGEGPFDGDCLKLSMDSELQTWLSGMYAKIVLSVESDEDLVSLYDSAKAAGLRCAIVTDLGRTEFHNVPTRTTVAIGPGDADLIDQITKSGTVKTKLA